jgi:putative endopeptidase
MHLISSAARLAAALLFCAGLAVTVPRVGAAPPQLPEPFDVRAIDRHADACKDFFAYATGSYRAAHPIPAAYTEYGYIEQLVDRTRDIVRDIIVAAQRKPASIGSNAQKIGTLYASCMNTAAIERQGLTPIAAELARISAITDQAALIPELAHLHAIGVDAGFALNAVPDIYDSTRILAEFDQGGLGLPERDYYFRADADSRKLRRQYVSHVATLLRLSGDRRADLDAPAIVALETRLARASKTVADLREPQATYHPMSTRAAATLAPNAALPVYLADVDVHPARVNVAEPAFLRAFSGGLADTPLPVLKAYFRWRLLDTFAAMLPARFEREDFDFHGRILNGAQAQLPRWKLCVNETNVLLPEAVGEAYVARAFAPPAKRIALDMTQRIKDAYRTEMAALTWLTPTTKRIAIAKLDAMKLKIGYPSVWRSYAGYAVTPNSYFANVARGQAFERRYELAKIGRPVNRAEWLMSPQTVNAYNDTQRNEIVVPAAQLQRPFYDPAGDDAANLAATGGGTIGHEMTHGFDDEGHKFDASGNLRNWWTPRDLANFNARAHCVIAQFDRTIATGTIHYQGRLVSGEAIADLGGVIIAYRALETARAGKPADRSAGFTPEQRYFLAFAQSWSEEIRPEAARTEALTDPHPLPRDRVNQTVANIPAWYAAFGCAKPRAPVCAIW